MSQTSSNNWSAIRQGSDWAVPVEILDSCLATAGMIKPRCDRMALTDAAEIEQTPITMWNGAIVLGTGAAAATNWPKYGNFILLKKLLNSFFGTAAALLLYCHWPMLNDYVTQCLEKKTSSLITVIET